VAKRGAEEKKKWDNLAVREKQRQRERDTSLWIFITEQVRRDKCQRTLYERKQQLDCAHPGQSHSTTHKESCPLVNTQTRHTPFSFYTCTHCMESSPFISKLVSVAIWGYIAISELFNCHGVGWPSKKPPLKYAQHNRCSSQHWLTDWFSTWWKKLRWSIMSFLCDCIGAFILQFFFFFSNCLHTKSLPVTQFLKPDTQTPNLQNHTLILGLFNFIKHFFQNTTHNSLCNT